MSRLSLRLDDGLLDRSLPHSSASFSVGGASWRRTRSQKLCRPQQLSVSCSDSLLVQTPRKSTSRLHHNSSVHSAASDTSLLSSLLDETSIQDASLVDTLWGLDHDVDPKESTIIADQSTVVANDTLIDSDSHGVKQFPMLSRIYCSEMEPNAASSSRYATATPSPSQAAPGPSKQGGPETSILYCRERSRSRKTGVLVSMWEAGVNQSSRFAACMVSLLILLCSRGHQVTDVLRLWPAVRRAAACCVSVLTHTWQVCQGQSSKTNTHGARTGHSGVMKESTADLRDLQTNRSLCQKAGEAIRWLSGQWHHVTAPDRASILTAFCPTLSLLSLLLLLLLLLSLCWLSPAGLQSVSSVLNVMEWKRLVPHVPGLSVYSAMSSQSQSADGAVVPLNSRPKPAEEEEVDRLSALEQSLSALWERVEVRGQQAEQRHREVLQLYAELQQQQQQQQQQVTSAQRGREDVGPWLRGVMDHQLTRIRKQLEKEQKKRMKQWSETPRLDELELQLQTLAAETQELQWKQEAASSSSPSPTSVPAADSAAEECESHQALLVRVVRLEEALEDIRRDVEGLSRVKEACGRLDVIQQTISSQVSSQVKVEVRAHVYGNQLTAGGGADSDPLPESLPRWLSQQYISRADLQAGLTSLELRLLQNISLQPEQRCRDERVKESILQTEGAVTQEDVYVMVRNALRLFSQDRTGLADYALESGGGSILSTRCSETYVTKAALLSLFGIPLWYFSQSPRVVIQPDVHPGNCWAFRGSTGILVIRLSMRILPTAFSLEHIPKALAPNGTLHSAPRDFSVYGLEDEHQGGGKLLGVYTYDEDGEALQTYAVTEENDQAFQIMQVQVLSNWGHQEYTCMYRFRVHGTPSGA